MNHNALIFRLFRWVAQLLAATAALTAPAQAATATFENLDRLDSLVAMTVGANLGEPGGPIAPIDRRLHLKPCPSTPKVEGPVFSAAIISCAEIGWRLRVPLSAAADRAPMVAMAPAARSGFSRPTAPAASAQAVIKKGDPVQLVAGSDVFSVSRLMIADEDGAVGDTIRVREDAKSPPVSAKIERAGVVRMPTI